MKWEDRVNWDKPSGIVLFALLSPFLFVWAVTMNLIAAPFTLCHELFVKNKTLNPFADKPQDTQKPKP